MEIMSQNERRITVVSVSVFFLLAALFLSSCRNPANPNEVTVSFDTAGGTPAIECQIIRRGRAVEPVDPPSRAGHRFMDWYGDPYFTYRWDFDNGVVRQDITLYARWTRIGGGGSGGGGGGLLPPGNDIHVPGAAGMNVYEQLEWMHNNPTHIQGGPDRVYIVTAHAAFVGSENIMSNNVPINFTAANPGDPVRVRIVSDATAQREIRMNNAGILFDVANDNILELQNVALLGVASDAVVDVKSDGILVMGSNSAIRNNSGRGVRVDGGTFRMYNTASITGNTGGGVHVMADGDFIMLGGTINTNTAVLGGGVLVNGGAKFEMEGGFISNNTATGTGVNEGGGGVHVSGADTSFIMSGGAIGGGFGGFNTAVLGGGVMVSGGAEFVMEGGFISHNIATNAATNEGGGGVHLTGNDSAFTMSDGIIEWNISNHAGGGVDVQANTTFTMYGGTIGPGNTATASTCMMSGGGGVHLIGANSLFTLDGGTISGNFASQGGGVRVAGGTFRMEYGIIFNNHAINGSRSGGGGVQAEILGRFELHGGSISENFSVNNGGGVMASLPWNCDVSNFSMTGGAIYNNIANNAGGGVSLSLGTRFEISGGFIYGTNSSTRPSNIINSPSNSAALWNGLFTTRLSPLVGGAFSGHSADTFPPP